MVSLRGRRFLMQFWELMAEFGDEIPWLQGLDDLRYATNAAWFCEELARRTGQRHGVVTPYQFVDGDVARTYIGGILHFSRSPECFRDRRNAEAAERLAAEGASFISCLQVRPFYRGHEVGHTAMHNALKAIRGRHGAVWGVVAKPRLQRFYASLGAELLGSEENGDGLRIVAWPAL